jgi:hypothetical protein
MIEFQKQDNSWVMRITEDRRIEVNEDVEVTDAAKKVLQAIQHLLQQRSKASTWVGLTEGDISDAWDEYENFQHAMRIIEAKLKAKNFAEETNQ